MTQFVTCPDCSAYETESKDKDRLVLALADRVCRQSELLSRRAEKGDDMKRVRLTIKDLLRIRLQAELTRLGRDPENVPPCDWRGEAVSMAEQCLRVLDHFGAPEGQCQRKRDHS